MAKTSGVYRRNLKLKEELVKIGSDKAIFKVGFKFKIDDRLFKSFSNTLNEYIYKLSMLNNEDLRPNAEIEHDHMYFRKRKAKRLVINPELKIDINLQKVVDGRIVEILSSAKVIDISEGGLGIELLEPVFYGEEVYVADLKFSDHEFPAELEIAHISINRE